MLYWKGITGSVIASFVNVMVLRSRQKEDYLCHVGRMRKFPNLLLDISGTGLFRYGLLASCAKTVGSERILFGTDYPMWTPAEEIEKVLALGLSDSDNRKVFSENFERLFGKA